jgi:tape measure domain-containing protein
MAGIQLPGAGLISELGGEFAMAAKQVLLFGTAYKALAFLTDFPGKVGEAIGQLQTFRNTLTTITGSSQEFGKSNKFILDLVEKYNVPLQSARDGFTKLYASMAPAGFKGDEIRDIFTGISQGAATFGMSADKVDRVNYAFAQMASKGQVMSEELKGQLGDVLPGAVAIFAEAAGFTGPEAMVKFTKAMEDGRYKGDAMKQLLINVGTVMNKEFGPGAEGAARTFQGLMNRMQNATLKLYEAFEPMAIGFANKVVLPMTDGLRVATDGFNAFFTGTLAKTDGGAAFAQQLNNHKPTFEGKSENLAAMIP